MGMLIQKEFKKKMFEERLKFLRRFFTRNFVSGEESLNTKTIK